MLPQRLKSTSSWMSTGIHFLMPPSPPNYTCWRTMLFPSSGNGVLVWASLVNMGQSQSMHNLMAWEGHLPPSLIPPNGSTSWWRNTSSKCVLTTFKSNLRRQKKCSKNQGSHYSLHCLTLPTYKYKNGKKFAQKKIHYLSLGLSCSKMIKAGLELCLESLKNQTSEI